MRHTPVLAVGAIVLVTMTPSLAAQSFYAPASAPQTGFAQSVSVGDGEIFIGEPLNTHTHGIVYVYRRGSGSPVWKETLQLKASAAAPNDYFGRALGVDGNTLLVGATAIDSSMGALYVFRKGRDGAWTQAARLRPSGVEPEDAFGRVIAVQNGTALVSTWGQDSASGAVYVFRRNGRGEWAEEARLVASDGQPESIFGSALDLDGNRALIGAVGAADGAGAAYLFRYDPARRAWSEEAKLTPRSLGENDQFGAAVVLSGDRAAVAAPGHDGFIGTVFTFVRDEESGRWREDGQLLPFDGSRNHRFGSSLAMSDNEVWVGAPGADGFEGRVYVFRLGDSTVTGVRKLAARDGERGDGFGGTVDVRGDVAVVGLTNDDFGEGTAAIFQRNRAGEWEEVARVLSDAGGYPAVTGGEVECEGGAVSVFSCNDVDLLSFLPVSAIGGARGVRMNDVWGWTDPETGKEWAIAGRMDGTAFVDVSDPSNPRFVANLPLTPGANPSSWRDTKVYSNHAFIVADGAGEHGMQVFDLTRLRSMGNPPQTVEPDYLYDRVNSVHNIVINEAAGFAYAVGAGSGGETCGGGLHMIDIREPKRPTFAGCFADTTTGRRRTGYTHDAQCVTYSGPDEEHRGKEVCFGANETALSVADVTDKGNPVALAVAEYPNVGYTHQGWLTEDQRYFFMDDELDELRGLVDKTRTLVWDVSDLDDPVLVREFFGTTGATDHNLYVKGDRVYQSNYVSGLRVLDIKDPENPREIAYFDTVPYGENAAGFGGSWSNYPFFESGTIVVTSGREGLFLVKSRATTLTP